MGIRYLSDEYSSTDPCAQLVVGILDFQAKGSVYRWSLILQKANQVADRMAKFDLSLDDKSKVFDFVPTFILNVVFADYLVVVFPCSF